MYLQKSKNNQMVLELNYLIRNYTTLNNANTMKIPNYCDYFPTIKKCIKQPP